MRCETIFRWTFFWYKNFIRIFQLNLLTEISQNYHLRVLLMELLQKTSVNNSQKKIQSLFTMLPLWKENVASTPTSTYNSNRTSEKKGFAFQINVLPFLLSLYLELKGFIILKRIRFIYYLFNTFRVFPGLWNEIEMKYIFGC